MLKPRHRRLLEELPKHDMKVYPSAVKAGYSPQYADKNPKQILKSALKAQAREVLDTLEGNKPVDMTEMKKTMSEIIGMSREEVFTRLVSIANQDKDLSSALKVLAPLAKDLGVNLGNDEDKKTIIPVLNIGIKQTDLPILEENYTVVTDNTAINKDIIDSEDTM